MSSEMRELVEELILCARANARSATEQGHEMTEAIHLSYEANFRQLRALLARTEAGADGAVAWTDDRGLERLREGKQELVSAVRLRSDTVALYTHPQDASGDAEDAARWRQVRQDGLIWRVNMLALAKDDIDILFDAKADAAVDAAMQAKEAK